MWAFDLVFAGDKDIRWEFRKSGKVEVEVSPVKVVVVGVGGGGGGGVGVSGPYTFRGCYAAISGATASAFVVTTFVSTQGLSSGE